MATPNREIPFCTIFLVLAAFACNLCVLIGNVETANAFKKMGVSAKGWSNVGTSMATSFNDELSSLFNKVSIDMSGAVAKIEEINGKIDGLLSVIGSSMDKSMLQLAGDVAHSVRAEARGSNPSTPTIQELEDKYMAEISAMAKTEVDKIEVVFDGFVDKLAPVLIQAGKWETSFGTTLQNDITQFGTVIDWVQKAFDTIMSKIHGGDPSWTDYMVYNTYTIFDQQNDGCITLDDLLKVSSAYGITAISGTKGEEVFEIYSVDGCIGVPQYLKLITDKGLSGILSTILRTYAEDLSEIGGIVSQARLRDEVSAAVVDYMDLVSAKNLTKITWISQRLTNASVPMAFTACVLYELVSSSPSYKLVDTGAIVLNDMMILNATYTIEAWDLLKNPGFWYTQGLLDTTLPQVVEQIGTWIAASVNATIAAEKEQAAMEANKSAEEKMPPMMAPPKMPPMKKHLALLSEHGLVKNGELAISPQKARAHAEQAVKRHRHELRMQNIEKREQLTASAGSRHLFRELLGGKTLSTPLTPTQWETLHQGVMAVPATLEFAKFLADNCSLDSSQYEHAVFSYSATSSNQLDSFANNIQNFAKKVVSFLSTMDQYCGESGVALIKSEINGFLTSAESSLISVILPKVKAVINEVVKKASEEGKSPEEIVKEIESQLESILGSTGMSMSLMQRGNLTNSSALESDATLAFETIAVLLSNLMNLLPSAVNTVNDARSETVQVAEVMMSIFNMFSVKGPEIFDAICEYYKIAWIAYFILLIPLTFGILWYGMWSSGFCGGPAPEEEQKDPETCMERLMCVKNCCCTCLSRCHDSQMCFWSCIIIFQIIVLLIFIIAIVICMLAGVKEFFIDSCSELYLLNEAGICTNDLNSIKQFIPSFVVDEFIPLEETCSSKELLMCNMIGTQMKQSVILTTIFSMISAILEFQLVIESAVLHERAKMRRVISGLKQESMD